MSNAVAELRSTDRVHLEGTSPLRLRWSQTPLPPHIFERRNTQFLGNFCASDDDRAVTSILRRGDELWVLGSDHRAICVRQDSDIVIAYAPSRSARDDCRVTIIHEWQPLFRHLLGTQVIHASAVLHNPSRTLLILAGPSHSGKSTIAFGMQRHLQWQQVADDFIGFRSTIHDIAIVPFPNLSRLRADSAKYFQRPVHENAELKNCKPGDLYNTRLLLLKPSCVLDSAPSLRPIRFDETTTRILELAFAVSTGHKWINRAMMLSYFHFAHTIPMFEFTYGLGFEKFDLVMDFLERSVLATDF